jgi:all-trans-8'-apo-beta-carotenal 15,15'-oxygenase
MASVAANPDAPWRRGMAPVYEEHALPSLDRIDGVVPDGLRGTLYRVGPGKHEVGGHTYDHWLDGDGMVRAFRIEGGRVSFRNRYVRTPWFEREAAAGRLLYLNFGTPMRGGLVRALLQGGIKNAANTNVLRVGDRLLALWEGGRPFALDPDTLATIGEEDFAGVLRRGAFFSAHPHRDAVTGDLYNIGSVVGRRPGLDVWRIRPTGQLEPAGRIALPKPFLVHDFCLTARHIVIVAGPNYMRLGRLVQHVLGRRSLLDCFAWHDQEPLRVFLIDRNGGRRVATYELDTAMMVHGANAYEDGDETVVDCVLYTEGNPFATVNEAFQGRVPTTPPGCLTRLRLRRGGKATRAVVARDGIDFPRIDERVSSRTHRYVYALRFENTSFGGSRLLKIDTERGTVQTHDFGPGHHAGEPVFAPRPGGQAEDDGWLLSMVYDARDHHSFLGIVPADRMGQDDTRVHLPFHSPLDFHGNFYAA